MMVAWWTRMLTEKWSGYVLKAQRFTAEQDVGYENKTGTKGNSKVFGLKIWRMDLHFTETGQLWKETVFEIDRSIKHLGGTLMSIRNSSRQLHL